jgi:hypothetical protein
MSVKTKIALILLASCLLLVATNFILQKGHSKYFKHDAARLEELNYGKENYDVIFIGSSRMHVHVNPFIIDSITGFTSYNFGFDGGNLLETNLWLKAYLDHHKNPKTVVLDLASFAFDIKSRPFFNFTMYLPYLDIPVVYKTISQYHNVWIYKQLPFLQFTLYDDFNKANCIRGLMGETQVVDIKRFNGYIGNGNNTLSENEKPKQLPAAFTLTDSGKAMLYSIIKTCKEKNIGLIITYSPEYYTADYRNSTAFFKFISTVSAENKIRFIDFRDSAISRNNLFFANIGHLNNKGATEYSKMIASELYVKH